jgi:hypothetical protein
MMYGKAAMSHRGVFAVLATAVVGGALLGVAAPAQASAFDDTVNCDNGGSWQPNTGSQDHGLQFAQSCQMYLQDVPPAPTPANAPQSNIPSGVIPGVDFGEVLQVFHFGP